MDEKNKDKIYEEILPLANAIKDLHEQIEKMVKDNIITREQADDMTGATIDKLEDEKLKKKRREVI